MNVTQHMPTTPRKRFISATEAAAFLGVSRAHVYDLAREGQIPFVRIGSVMKFRPDELDKFFSSPLMRDQKND